MQSKLFIIIAMIAINQALVAMNIPATQAARPVEQAVPKSDIPRHPIFVSLIVIDPLKSAVLLGKIREENIPPSRRGPEIWTVPASYMNPSDFVMARTAQRIAQSINMNVLNVRLVYEICIANSIPSEDTNVLNVGYATSVFTGTPEHSELGGFRWFKRDELPADCQYAEPSNTRNQLESIIKAYTER